MIKEFTKKNESGFSLIELAIVLVIVGILLGGFVGTLGKRIESTRRSETHLQLSNINDAIIGFASTTGRIPCPAISTSAGLESGGDAVDCTAQHGFVPGRTLGIYGSYNKDGLLRDSWGNPIRYSVTNQDTYAFVKSDGNGGMKETGIANLSPDLIVCDVDTTSDTDTTCTAGDTVNDSVPYMILSLGRDGNEYVTTVKSNSDQQENSGEATAAVNAGGENITYLVPNDIVFVKRTYSDVGSSAGFFDDILYWESPYVLYAKMIEAGQLP